MFCFVILHYLTANDTIECVDSILTIQGSYHVVIVDNGSNNGSIEIVEKRFINYKNIHIIKNNNNIGFASGNNVGYQFARDILHADFIAISNNDVIVATTNMIELIESYFLKNRFFLLGPDIESLVDHKHQNPMSINKLGIKQVSREIWKYRILLCLSRMGFYDKVKRIKNKQPTTYMDYEVTMEDIQLHGSFLVFSPLYTSQEKFSFRPGTFLYMEEAILHNYCLKKGYKTVYYPEIKVFHKEDSSTNSQFTKNRDKREFVFRNMIRSLKVYKEVLVKDD